MFYKSIVNDWKISVDLLLPLKLYKLLFVIMKCLAYPIIYLLYFFNFTDIIIISVGSILQNTYQLNHFLPLVLFLFIHGTFDQG